MGQYIPVHRSFSLCRWHRLAKSRLPGRPPPAALASRALHYPCRRRLDWLLRHDNRGPRRGISLMSQAERLCQRGARGNAAARTSRSSSGASKRSIAESINIIDRKGSSGQRLERKRAAGHHRHCGDLSDLALICCRSCEHSSCSRLIHFAANIPSVRKADLRLIAFRVAYLALSRVRVTGLSERSRSCDHEPRFCGNANSDGLRRRIYAQLCTRRRCAFTCTRRG